MEDHRVATLQRSPGEKTPQHAAEIGRIVVVRPESDQPHGSEYLLVDSLHFPSVGQRRRRGRPRRFVASRNNVVDSGSGEKELMGYQENGVGKVEGRVGNRRWDGDETVTVRQLAPPQAVLLTPEDDGHFMRPGQRRRF